MKTKSDNYKSRNAAKIATLAVLHYLFAPSRRCGKFTVLLCAFVPLWKTTIAQLNTDNLYRKPLKEVLVDIQKKYGVQIKYVDSMVINKWVNYADWRYRTDVDVTLDNVLSPLDLKVKKEKDKVYKLSYFEYYRWNVEEGWAELDRIASQYKSITEWEKRKTELRSCLLEALQLTHLPPSPRTPPIKANFRKLTGYTVENIAIEILPGVWVNGSLYKPDKIKGRIPVVLHPQ